MHWTGHHWALIYMLAVIVIMYRPPKSLDGATEFLSTHFGDSIGLLLLYTGIGLLVLGGFYQQLTAIIQVGNSLVMTSVGVLKLTKAPAGGNGSGSGNSNGQGAQTPPPGTPTV